MKTLSIFLWVSILAFASDATFSEIKNGYARAHDPKILNISVIEQSTADDLFKEFVADKDIPYKYLVDGCYARATEMARIAEKRNIFLGKVFAEGNLQATTGNPAKPLAQWGFHVAPIAYVTSPDGSGELLVFDPSLFTKPVTLREWKARMQHSTPHYTASVFRVYYGSRFQYYSKSYAHEPYKSEWSQKDLENTQSRLQEYLGLQNQPPVATTKHNKAHVGAIR